MTQAHSGGNDVPTEVVVIVGRAGEGRMRDTEYMLPGTHGAHQASGVKVLELIL